VRLVGQNGQSVALTPTRYEFPGAVSGEDADWVVVDGHAITHQGVWRFQDAALQASDGPIIGEWLLAAARSEVLPTRPDQDPALTFLEPALGFSVASYGDQMVTLRVHLTYEAAPPWLNIDERLDIRSFFVELDIGMADLETAAADWNREAIALPRRSST
jgi:hypothetical protein